MADATPSRVFPIPGFNGGISSHGGPEFVGGSDIFAPKGSDVVSIVSGKVNFISTSATAPTSGGNAVEILGSDGLTYYFAHLLNAPTLKVGDTVKAGQMLGQVDNSGNAKTTASHLHIGIGHGISVGTGPAGGIGKNFNAVNLLKALQVDTRANDPEILGKTPKPPEIKFNPSIDGFTEGRASDIFLNLKKAIEASVDPFLWLAIVSKESGFNPNAVNNTSGACGYAQIYPCIPGLSPEQNIAEGLKRLKSFLDGCGGDVNCALNRYSGGGGQPYIKDVLGRAGLIKQGNPDLSSIDPSFDPTTNPNDPDSVDTENQCPPIILNLGPVDVPFPDVGCIIRTTLYAMTNKLTDWWKAWQVEHVPNWTFVWLGLILLIIGGFGFVMQSGMLEKAPGGVGTVAKVAKAAV